MTLETKFLYESEHYHIAEFLDIANTLVRYTQTNMTPMDIINISNQALKNGDKEFDELEFLLEGHRTDHTINDERGWIIEWKKSIIKMRFINLYLTVQII